jgi:tetratricopeptide (TPR) repeat protein
MRPHVRRAFGQSSVANAAWDASLAEHLLAAGRWAEAASWADAAAVHMLRHHPDRIHADPASVVARLVAANAKAQQGDAADALAAIDAIDAIDATLPEASRNELESVVARHRGEVLVRLGRRHEAAAAFASAIEALDRASPGPDAETLGLLARLAATTEDREVARAASDRAEAMADALGVAMPTIVERSRSTP